MIGLILISRVAILTYIALIMCKHPSLHTLIVSCAVDDSHWDSGEMKFQ